MDLATKSSCASQNLAVLCSTQQYAFSSLFYLFYTPCLLIHVSPSAFTDTRMQTSMDARENQKRQQQPQQPTLDVARPRE